MLSHNHPLCECSVYFSYPDSQRGLTQWKRLIFTGFAGRVGFGLYSSCGPSVQPQPTLMSNNSQAGVCGTQQLRLFKKALHSCWFIQVEARSSAYQQGKGNDYEMIFSAVLWSEAQL